jgi:hypothetical protein
MKPFFWPILHHPSRSFIPYFLLYSFRKRDLFICIVSLADNRLNSELPQKISINLLFGLKNSNAQNFDIITPLGEMVVIIYNGCFHSTKS